MPSTSTQGIRNTVSGRPGPKRFFVLINHPTRISALLVLAGLLVRGGPVSAADATPGVSQVQLEALQRLRGVDLESNPALKTAVMKIVEATRGTPQFVELVEQFKIKDQNEGLLAVALRFPGDASGVKAMRLMLESGGRPLIKRALDSQAESNRTACVEALGNTRMPAVNELITPMLANERTSDGVRREVIKALCKNEAGARQLLALGGSNTLDDALKLTAATALSQVGWADIREQAGRHFPLPKAGGDEALPSIPELAKRTGDPARGKLVFFSETTACKRCHQVAGQGIAIGPDLSQIGDKLGKDALLEAILDPNNGIAFGYEAWTVTTKDDEEIDGIVVSETADELAVKDLSGIVHRLAKSTIASRTASKFSLMPAGLQATMSVQQLVDLVEYLSGLKKPAGQ